MMMTGVTPLFLYLYIFFSFLIHFFFILMHFFFALSRPCLISWHTLEAVLLGQHRAQAGSESGCCCWYTSSAASPSRAEITLTRQAGQMIGEPR
jgi:hypothetical protein